MGKFILNLPSDSCMIGVEKREVKGRKPATCCNIKQHTVIISKTVIPQVWLGSIFEKNRPRQEAGIASP